MKGSGVVGTAMPWADPLVLLVIAAALVTSSAEPSNIDGRLYLLRGSQCSWREVSADDVCGSAAFVSTPPPPPPSGGVRERPRSWYSASVASFPVPPRQQADRSGAQLTVAADAKTRASAAATSASLARSAAALRLAPQQQQPPPPGGNRVAAADSRDGESGIEDRDETFTVTGAAAAADDDDAALLADVQERLLSRRRRAAALMAELRSAEAERRSQADEYERKAERAAAELDAAGERLRRSERQLAAATERAERAEELLAKARAQLADAQREARDGELRAAAEQSAAAERLSAAAARAAALERQLATERAEREELAAAARRNASAAAEEAQRVAAAELAAQRTAAAAALDEERRRAARNATLAQQALDYQTRQSAQLRAQANESSQRLAAAANEVKELKYRLRELEGSLAKRDADFRECLAAKTQTFCGFEGGNLCGYQQETTDGFDWTLRRDHAGAAAARRQLATRPDADHTCSGAAAAPAPPATGSYVYARAGAHRQGSTARLISPRYSHVNGTLCFSFWYHIFGRHVGLLNVRALIPRLPEAGGTTSLLIWSTRGQGRRGWYRAHFDVPPSVASSSFHIAFEAVSGGGGRDEADIAIDDVAVTDGPCSASPVWLPSSGPSDDVDVGDDSALSNGGGGGGPA